MDRRSFLFSAVGAPAADPARPLDPLAPGRIANRETRAAIGASRIAPEIELIRTEGYSVPGDRGAATYVRTAAEPRHEGKVRSQDGAWWMLVEPVLTPFMFGAVGDGRTNDAPALQRMFDYIEARNLASPVSLAGGNFYLASGLTLPTVTTTTVLEVRGDGARLRTDRIITILGRPHASVGEALRRISAVMYDISGIEFIGSGREGQIGLHLSGCFTPVVRHCHFQSLDYGSIGTFCLSGRWLDLRFGDCKRRPFLLQSGVGHGEGAVWDDATTSNSQSNVNVVENCRVYAANTQRAAFSIFASDRVVLRNCISEGVGGTYDVEFDYGGSTTTKHFDIQGLHCEAAGTKCNLRIRAAGRVTLSGLVLQYPAALLDLSGSNYFHLKVQDVPWLVPPTSDPANPNNRLIFQTDGNGYGAVGESSNRSPGTSIEFIGVTEAIADELRTASRWEGGRLPWNLTIHFMRGANGGEEAYSTAPYGIRAPEMRVLNLAGSPVLHVDRLAIRPGVDNASTGGAPGFRYSQIHSATGTINTSDAREKTAVRPLTNAELAAARALGEEIGVFQFLDAVAEKGESARLHVGMTVQRAIEIMRTHGLDPMRYGFICFDAWEGGADGPAGNRYGFRVEALALFLMRGLESRLSALERPSRT